MYTLINTGTSLPTTVLFMFTWWLYVRKKPARPHCHCCQRPKREAEKKSVSDAQDSDSERSPLLGERATSSPEVSLSPKLSWKERTKQLVPFLGLFAPLVVFWAIFYQQSSTWVVQGRHMNCYIGKLHVPPGT